MKQFQPVIRLLVALLIFIPLASWAFAEITGAAGQPPDIERKEEEFLSFSREMKEFLEIHVMKVNDPGERLRNLIDAIFDRSLLNFEYSNQRTYTAAETFSQRTGNCLSYTAMLVVMARQAGLPAYFQEVRDYSHWSKRGNIVVFNRHMNAVVEAGGRPIEVDFDFSTAKKLRRTRIVSDRRAQAHYYNNLGAEALIEKNYPRAESLFKTAVRLDENFSPPWTNLGFLYQYQQHTNKAEEAYKKAISLDNQDFTAQMNLAKLYQAGGEIAKAIKTRKRAEKYCQKNPFYHYSLGETAFAASDFAAAIHHYKQAIKREPKEPEFYQRLAAAYIMQGNQKAAEKWLQKAQKLQKRIKSSQ